MSKKLVAYFSASGNTRGVASRLAKLEEASLYEILPKKPYTNEDLNWLDKNSRSSIEMRDKTSRPEIANKVDDMSQYDVIYIGFPIWWYVAPTIINTFLESYDFSDKIIVLFATSGGSGFGRTKDNLEASCKGATIKEGKVFSPGIGDEELKEWAKEVL